MTEEFVLAIDAGTTGCRAAAFSINGTKLANHYQEFPSSFPEPDWVEQNAGDWWDAICKSTRGVMEQLRGKGSLAAMSVTNQRETIVPVDGSGKQLRPALVWQDRRSTAECEWLRKEIGEEKIYKTTGLTIDPYFSVPKLLWLREHEKDIFESAEKFLLVHDYVLFKLTGEFITDHSNASRTMLFDLGERRWSEELMDTVQVPVEKLPEVKPSGSPAGQLDENAARETGLPPGTPVFVGAGDQQCAALGIGVTAPGRVKATTGTGTFVLAYTEKPMFDPERRVLCSAHSVPGAYVVEASIFTTGAVYRWIRDNFAKELLLGDQSPYKALDSEAEESEPGAQDVTFIPHMAGAGAPHWNPEAVGMIHGLSLGHTRGDVVRAMMEGVAVEIRKNVEVMKTMKLSVDELRLTGGGAKSKLWCHIQTDMCGIPALRAETEGATVLGAAILAAVGAGLHNSIDDAVKEMVRIKDRIEPDTSVKDIYQQVYDRSIRLYKSN